VSSTAISSYESWWSNLRKLQIFDYLKWKCLKCGCEVVVGGVYEEEAVCPCIVNVYLCISV